MYKHLFDIPLLTQYTQFVGVISFYLKTFILILAPGCRRQQIRLQNKFLAASPNHIYPKYAHFSISQSVFAICSLLIESFVWPFAVEYIFMAHLCSSNPRLQWNPNSTGLPLTMSIRRAMSGICKHIIILAHTKQLYFISFRISFTLIRIPLDDNEIEGSNP